MKKKPPAIEMPLTLKQLPDDFIPLHERPTLAQEIVDLQELTAGRTRQQDMEEAMDQSGSHVSPSEVGSAGCSETRSEVRAIAELAAIEHLVLNKTASEKHD